MTAKRKKKFDKVYDIDKLVIRDSQVLAKLGWGLMIFWGCESDNQSLEIDWSSLVSRHLHVRLSC